MRKINQIIKKNFKVLLRNKLSLFILLLGPIILTFLIGFFYFNSNSFSINLGLYKPDNSEFNNFFSSEIEKSDFSILYYNSQNECEDKMKAGLIHACIYLPENFKIDDSKNNELILKIDTSRGDIVAVTENLINDQISKISNQVQILNTKKLLKIINASENLIEYNDNQFNSVNLITAELKKDNEYIKVKNTQVSGLLNKKSLGLEELESKYKSLNLTLHSKSNTAYKKLNDSLTDIELAIEKLKESNTTIAKDGKDFVVDARLDVGSAKSTVEGIKKLYFLKQLGTIVYGAGDKLNKASTSAADLTWELNSKIDTSNKKTENISSILATTSLKGKELVTSISTLESKNPQTLMNPISVKTQNVVANSNVHLVSIFPSLIVGLIFIISLIMSSMFILTERKNQAHFRNFMSNNSALNFFVGDFLSLFLIVFMQAGLIITMYHFWFVKSTDYIQYAILLGLILPIIAIFILVGMLVGYLTKNESSNVILTFLVILSFLTLSGKILPIEALSTSVAQIAVLNPFILGEGMIRKFLLFGVQVSQMKTELLLISIYCGIFLVLNYVFESFSKKRFLYGIYSYILISIRNYFVKPAPQLAPTQPVQTTTKTSTTNKTTTVKTKNTDIKINPKPEDDDDIFELESLAQVNKKLEKL